MKQPIALIILDGYGNNDSEYGNAIKAAKKPNIDRIFSQASVTSIGASGLEVGLPDGQMGNSEVGHTNIGAGRVVYQELTRITKSIKDGDFFDKAELVATMTACKENSTALHLMGLLSDGGVHSHIEHVYGLLEMAKRIGLTDVYVHCFMDGRDVPPSSGKSFVAELYQKMQEIGIGKIATVIGRYYAMDRDNRWDRVEKAYAAMVYGEGVTCDCPAQAIADSYEKNITDEFIDPIVVNSGASIKENDSVVFFNFRPDRAREIARVFVDESFDSFERKKGFFNLNFVCLTQYDVTMPNVCVAFKPQSLANTLGEYLSDNGKTQLRIAETEKYAHVTFFFNGGIEAEFAGEDRALVDSPKVATYDLKPEMSAYEVCDEAIKRINSDKYDVIILNYANCDMVGHTGLFDAAVSAVEAVDACVGKTVDALLAKGGIALITADHGNADKMYEPNGSPFTAHTTNNVPFAVCGKTVALRDNGKLADIAPTMLELIGLTKPAEMDGTSLILA